jgi:hypothetical protein
MQWIPIIGILASFGAAVLIVFFIGRSRQRRMEIQAQVQSKLIDRFGSAPELVEFLQSPAGRQFVSGVQTAPVTMARERIHSGFTRAILMTSLGAAFLFLTYFSDDDFIVPAAILFSLGIGYIIATFLSYRLSRLPVSEFPSREA